MKRIAAGHYEADTVEGRFELERRQDAPGYPGTDWVLTDPSGHVTHHETKTEAMGDVAMTMDELSQACRKTYDAAVADLGDDLGGFSVLDLLADNHPYPLDVLTAAARHAGIVSDPDDAEAGFHVTVAGRDVSTTIMADSPKAAARLAFAGVSDAFHVGAVRIRGGAHGTRFYECTSMHGSVPQVEDSTAIRYNDVDQAERQARQGGAAQAFGMVREGHRWPQKDDQVRCIHPDAPKKPWLVVDTQGHQLLLEDSMGMRAWEDRDMVELVELDEATDNDGESCVIWMRDRQGYVAGVDVGRPESTRDLSAATVFPTRHAARCFVNDMAGSIIDADVDFLTLPDDFNPTPTPAEAHAELTADAQARRDATIANCTDAATPRPWTAEHGLGMGASFTIRTTRDRRDFPADGDPADRVVFDLHCPQVSGETDANLALVLRAVNSHDALVAALMVAREWVGLDTPGGAPCDSWPDWFNHDEREGDHTNAKRIRAMIEDALAKAGALKPATR